MGGQCRTSRANNLPLGLASRPPALALPTLPCITSDACEVGWKSIIMSYSIHACDGCSELAELRIVGREWTTLPGFCPTSKHLDTAHHCLIRAHRTRPKCSMRLTGAPVGEERQAYVVNALPPPRPPFSILFWNSCAAPFPLLFCLSSWSGWYGWTRRRRAVG